MPPCLTLSIIRYGSRVKWSNPGKGAAPSHTPWCSSYRKESLWVALDYGRQLYIYIYIYILKERERERFFFFHHTTCESMCDTLASSAANQGDNTVSVAQGGTATPGATKQLLPLDRVFKRNIYLCIHKIN